MTDNEIIKALECCSVHPMKCNKCPYKGNECCTNAHRKDALDLINRQKAEIESMQKTIFKKEDLMQMLCSQKQVYYDELVSAKAEIERLADYNKQLRYDVKKIRTEARKEFAERLKVKKATHYCKCGLSIDTTELINDDIDNLVKEMEKEP